MPHAQRSQAMRGITPEHGSKEPCKSRRVSLALKLHRARLARCTGSSSARDFTAQDKTEVAEKLECAAEPK
jgi:hypothetical protein